MAKDKNEARLDLQGVPDNAVLTQINKKYGANTLVIASQALGAQIRFYSTGCFAMDFALGGGIPRNRISEIRGGYSTLKSTLALLALANFQIEEEEGRGIYVDVEKTYDPVYAAKLGVDNDRTYVVNPDSGEQAVDVLAELLDMGRPTFTVVDSIAAMTPASEIESSMDQQTMGLHPRLINRMMRVVTARMKRSMYDNSVPPSTVFAINQIREKIGVVYGNPETAPGGRGKEFAYSAIIKVNSSPSKAIKESVERNGEKRVIRFGQIVDFTIMKNKTSGSQFEEGDFEYYNRPHKIYEAFQINNAFAAFKYGVFYGVISLNGQFYEYRNKLLKIDISLRKAEAFIKAIHGNLILSKAIYREILEAIIDEQGLNPDAAVKGQASEEKKLKVRIG